MSEYGWLIEQQVLSRPIFLKPAEQCTKHVLLIDHYDSFTQLIKVYFEQLGARVSVFQFDDMALNHSESLAFTHVVLSPGPGSPEEADATRAFILKYHQQYPMLGVCLGHQCLIKALGGEVIDAFEIAHGKPFEITHTNTGLLKGIKQPFIATRYHSLVASYSELPGYWDVTAWTYDAIGSAVIMGVQHQTYALFGVQFHPEAILTEQGMQIFKNFLSV